MALVGFPCIVSLWGGILHLCSFHRLASFLPCSFLGRELIVVALLQSEFALQLHSNIALHVTACRSSILSAQLLLSFQAFLWRDSGKNNELHPTPASNGQSSGLTPLRSMSGSTNPESSAIPEWVQHLGLVFKGIVLWKIFETNLHVYVSNAAIMEE